MRRVSSTDAAKVLGIDYHSLYEWKRIRVLVPSTVKWGKRKIAQYNLSDLVAAKALQNMRECSVPQKAARKAVKLLQRFKGPYDNARLVISRDIVEITGSDDEFFRFYRLHGNVYVDELDQVMADVEARMDKVLENGVGLAEAI